MLNSNIIHPRHVHSIQTSLLKNRSAADEARVTRLYRAAKSLYSDPTTFTPEKGIITTRGNAFDRALEVTATDEETGLFIEFTGASDAGFEGASLVFGQKFCQERRDVMRKNITTRIWSK